MSYRIGIDVGGTNLVAGLVDEEYHVLARAKRRTRKLKDADALCVEMAAVAREAARAGGADDGDIELVGIGIPGAIDRDRGVVLHTPNAPFHNTPVRELFQREWNVPVYLGNDANCAAVGEYLAGAAKGCRSAMVITLGTGVGAGIIVDGRLFTGCNDTGLEAGHTVIQVDGRQCNCGRRGCWERYSSATGLKQSTREAMEQHPESLLWSLAGGTLDGVGGRTAFQAAREGDETARMVVDEYIRYLAIGLTNMINLFQPEIICLGGGVSNEGDDLFLDPLRALVERDRYTTEGPQTRLVKAALGNDAGIVGAAVPFLDRRQDP